MRAVSTASAGCASSSGSRCSAGSSASSASVTTATAAAAQPHRTARLPLLRRASRPFLLQHDRPTTATTTQPTVSHLSRAAAVELGTSSSDDERQQQQQQQPQQQSQQGTSLAGLSYSSQYDVLFASQLNTGKVVPKPSAEAQEREPNAYKVFQSSVHAVGKRSLTKRSWNVTDYTYAGFLGGMHLLALAAPFTFSWPMVYLFLGSYFVTGCLGITLSFHRQLAHRSFQTPKWVEYALAYCGVLAVQGDPLEWASSHRYHHLHTDTPLDPHSPYEGFWWSHFGWLLDNQATNTRVHNRSNASDMEGQWFYRWLRDTYAWHVVAQFAVLFAVGGLPAVVWGGALRMVWVYHITWAVNSATHVWGNQVYKTGDLSRNNWWMGILAWGEGWHNNHHAFEFSARHGLEWWQVDITWGLIWALQQVGLATNVKLPTERQKAKLAF